MWFLVVVCNMNYIEDCWIFYLFFVGVGFGVVVYIFVISFGRLVVIFNFILVNMWWWLFVMVDKEVMLVLLFILIVNILILVCLSILVGCVILLEDLLLVIIIRILVWEDDCDLVYKYFLVKCNVCFVYECLWGKLIFFIVFNKLYLCEKVWKLDIGIGVFEYVIILIWV